MLTKPDVKPASLDAPLSLWERRHGVRVANCCHEPVVASLPSSPSLLPGGIGIYTSRLSRAHSSLRNRIVGRKSVAPSAVCKGGRQFTSARVSPQSRSQWMERGGISVESSYGERLDLTTLEHSCGGRRYAFPPYSNEDV